MHTLLHGVIEFKTYILTNRHIIPNLTEWHQQRDAVNTPFVESTMNQVVSKWFMKKQQLQWTLQGGHLLLQTSTLPGARTFDRSNNGRRIDSLRQP